MNFDPDSYQLKESQCLDWKTHSSARKVLASGKPLDDFAPRLHYSGSRLVEVAIQ